MIWELLLIRHGEAEHLVKDITGGWSDTKLTHKGRRDVLKTAEFFQKQFDTSIFTLLSSDLIRASQTAEILEGHLGLKKHLHKELRELSNGQAKNLTNSEAEKIFTPQTEPFLDWKPYPEAESWRMLCQRVYRFMNWLNGDTHPYDKSRYIIVSHANTIRAMIHWWLGIDYTQKTDIFYDIDPCSITHLQINTWGERSIAKLNQTLHFSFE